MSKKLKIALGVILALLISFGTGYWLYQRTHQDTQSETVKLAEPDYEEPTEEVESTDTEEPQDQSEQANEEKGGSIDDNIDKILSIAEGLNDFQVGYSKDFEDVKSALAEYGITVDPNLPTPYGVYEFTDGIVMSAYVESSLYIKDGKDYTLRLITSTATSLNEIADSKARYNAVPKVAKEIYAYLKKYGDSQAVDYRLTVSEDGKTAKLTLESGKWW